MSQSDQHLQVIEQQTRLIDQALHGSSNALQRFDLESDPIPQRLLGAASAHTFNALSAVLVELRELRAEVEALRSGRPEHGGLFRR